MRVPQLENKVNIQSGQVSPAKVPLPNEEAFGVNVAREQAGVGEAGVKLGLVLTKHIQERNDWRAKEQATELYNKYVNAAFDQNYNTNLKEIQNPDGTVSKIPSGFMVRKGHAANGATLEFVEQRKALRDSYASQIKNPLTLAYFNELADKLDTSDKNNLVKYETEQWQSAAKDSVYQFANTQLNRYPLADEKEKQSIISEVKNRYKEAEDAGFMTSKESIEGYQNFMESLVDQDIARDNATTPEQSYTLSELVKGDKGAYAGLSDKDRASLVERMQIKIGRNKKLTEFAIQQNQDQNEKQIYVDWLDKKATPTQVKDAILAGGIRLRFGRKLIEDFYKNDINPKTDFSVYNEVKNMQLRDEPIEQVNQFILDNSNKLSNTDTKQLLNSSYSEEDKKNKMTIKFSAEALKDWADKTVGSLIIKDNVSSEIVYDFLQRVDKERAKGKRIDEILKETQKDYIKKYNPSTALMDDTPNIIASRNKIQKIYNASSKLKGNKPTPKVYTSGGSGIDFDEL